MSRSSDITVNEVKVQFEPCPFRAPLKFGGRVVTQADIVNVEVTVTTRDGRRGTGRGSMPLGSVWAWPSVRVEPEVASEIVRRLTSRIARRAMQNHPPAHPLVLVRNLHAGYADEAAATVREFEISEAVPPLAILLAASPIDAAIHDAFGRVNEVNSFNALSADFIDQDLSAFLTDAFKGEYLDRYTRRQPQPTMPLYHLVGALDPLTPADVRSPIGDGLPETLADWIPADGLTHLKIKLNGDDQRWDVERVLAVEAVATSAQAARGCTRWHYSLDFNEKCPDVSYVVEFLHRLREQSPAAYDRVQYLEQPTHRDLRTHRHQRMHEAARLKPVVIDESLTDLESLLLARDMGYTGVALKACKGQTEALLMAAAAQKFGLFLCVQDLTCPGASFLHSAALAARIPTVAAIEGNARQYCPIGNQGWRERFPTLFQIHDGTVGTGVLTGPGLGF